MASHPNWYVLRVRNGFEALVATYLHKHGFETFVPEHSPVRTRDTRSRNILFPGYVFSRFELEQQPLVLTTPGVLSLVGVPKPVPLDDGEVVHLRSAIRSGLPMQVLRLVPAKQRVQVSDGPLRGLRGIIVELNAKRYFALNLKLIERTLAFEWTESWSVRSCDVSRRSGQSVSVTPLLRRAKAKS